MAVKDLWPTPGALLCLDLTPKPSPPYPDGNEDLGTTAVYTPPANNVSLTSANSYAFRPQNPSSPYFLHLILPDLSLDELLSL
ncbi:hypothetical protein J6590_026907 [Homalodisca vitripennis]|nr:hypothetical protein J6590_026907 [Homalodisca vitripennis]